MHTDEKTDEEERVEHEHRQQRGHDEGHESCASCAADELTFLPAPRELKYQLIDAEVQVMLTLGLPMLYPQIAALKGTAKFQTLVVCAIGDFLPSAVGVATSVSPARESAASIASASLSARVEATTT